MNPAPIVLTRLAIRATGAVAAPDEAWVRERVALLRRLGWPALQRAGRGIAWVLVVDPERRALVEDLLGDLELPDGSVHLAVGEGFIPTTAALEVAGVVHPGRDRFVTVRMDSDDALLPGAIDAVVAVAAPAPAGALVDLPRGYQLDLEQGDLIEVEYRRWRQGPFLALVHHDRATMLDTGGEHPRAREGRAVVRVDAPAWIQGVHGANVSNERHELTAPVRALRAVRSLPRGDAAAAWRDGRVVAAGAAAAILERAGLVGVT